MRSILRLMAMTFVVALCSVLLIEHTRSLTNQSFPWIVVAVITALGLVVWITRTGTAYAAATGAIFAACLATSPTAAPDYPLYRSAFPALLMLFVLTTAATRFRRAKKIAMGLSEPLGGRTAAQVTANLGPAAVFAVLAGNTNNMSLRTAMIAGAVAALAETTADTLASELGETFHGRVRLITTLKEVSPGTDGGVSLKGTAVGVFGAAIIVLACLVTMRLSLNVAATALLAAAAGLFLDSLLGATFEARGYLTNNKVNFISTLTAGLLAAAFAS